MRRKIKHIGQVIDLLDLERSIKRHRGIVGLLIVVGVLVAGFFVSFIYFYTMVYPEMTSEIEVVGNVSYEIPDCSNKTLMNTSICLYEFVDEVFNYTITPDYYTLTHEQLIARGGDCKDWTDFYEAQLNKYGFTTAREKIFVEEEVRENNKTVEISHVFLIASDETGYCILDMEFLDCVSYMNEDGEVKPKKNG